MEGDLVCGSLELEIFGGVGIMMKEELCYGCGYKKGD